MSGIMLSREIDEVESQWEKESEELFNRIAERIKEKMGLDVFEATKQDNAEAAIMQSSLLFLDKKKKLFYEVLEEEGIDVELFEKNVYLNTFVLSLIRKSSNSSFVGDLLKKNDILNDYSEDKDGLITIDCKFGRFFMKRAREEFAYDLPLNKFLNRIPVSSGCHQIAEYLLEHNDLTAVTGFALKNYAKNYFHSIALDDDDYVIDLALNVIMYKDVYYNVFDFVETHRVKSYGEFEKESELSKPYDESKTLYPILRNAHYMYSYVDKDVDDSDRNNEDR